MNFKERAEDIIYNFNQFSKTTIPKKIKYELGYSYPHNHLSGYIISALKEAYEQGMKEVRNHLSVSSRGNDNDCLKICDEIADE